MAVRPRMTAEDVARLPPAERRKFLNGLSPREAQELVHHWGFWARANQLAPEGDWRTWLVLAGRGFGKTRTGAEHVRDMVECGRWRRVALVAPTAADARDVMVEGESGLLAVCPPSFMPKYQPGKRRLVWPNGAIATTYSAEQPRRLRGPQHDGAWADELAAWRYTETWDMLMFGLRLGDDPRTVVTTTPRPIPLVRELMSSATTIVTRGTTYDNRANLAPAFMSSIIRKYEGTRLGRQELNAELLDDNPYALWKRDQVEALRRGQRDVPELVRIVVAVDPQVADPKPVEKKDPESAETGIVVAGVDRMGHFWVLEDASLLGSPGEWAGRAVDKYIEYEADCIVAEVNNGGAMVEFTVSTVAAARGLNVAYKGVHASRGKQTRAEPVASVYEHGRAHHVGAFPVLEDQMCEWVPGMKSPDRMDALVWAATDLAVEIPEPSKSVPINPADRIAGFLRR